MRRNAVTVALKPGITLPQQGQIWEPAHFNRGWFHVQRPMLLSGIIAHLGHLRDRGRPAQSGAGEGGEAEPQRRKRAPSHNGAQEWLVYCFLKSICDRQNGRCEITLTELSDRVCLSESHLLTILRTLDKAGLVRRDHTRKLVVYEQAAIELPDIGTVRTSVPYTSADYQELLTDLQRCIDENIEKVVLNATVLDDNGPRVFSSDHVAEIREGETASYPADQLAFDLQSTEANVNLTYFHIMRYLLGSATMIDRIGADAFAAFSIIRAASHHHHGNTVITRARIANLMGCSTRTVDRALQTLGEMNMITRAELSKLSTNEVFRLERFGKEVANVTAVYSASSFIPLLEQVKKFAETGACNLTLNVNVVTTGDNSTVNITHQTLNHIHAPAHSVSMTSGQGVVVRPELAQNVLSHWRKKLRSRS